MKSSSHRAEYLLAVSSGVLLGAAFPPLPLFVLAYVAFIPFLFLWERLTKLTEVIRYGYVFVLAFQVVTLYWQGGYAIGKDVWLMVSNLALILGHPLFFLPTMLLAFYIRRKTSRPVGLLAFALLWIAFEYVHSLGELSFPWVTIGNSQAYDLPRIQIAEYVSVFGISAVLLTFNVVLFHLLWNLATGRWTLQTRALHATAGGLVAAFLGLTLYGSVRIHQIETSPAPSLKVGMVQPNFDPWEKWGEGFASKWESYDGQFRALMALSQPLAAESLDVLVWPETAIPFHIFHPRFAPEKQTLAGFVAGMRTPLFTGVPHAEYFPEESAPVTAERIGTSSTFVESYNAATLITPDGASAPFYKKMILVPYGERIPYAETFRFLIAPLKWNVGISSWGKGTDTVLFDLRRRDGTMTRFAGMICYESAYPDFVRGLVQRGADWLTVITNDSWWGNTSGAYQHAAFASLRAVEARRSVIQCANGGISLAVGPTGKVLRRTSMYEQTTLVAGLPLRNERTWYTRHGNVVAQISCAGGLLLALFALFKRKNA